MFHIIHKHNNDVLHKFSKTDHKSRRVSERVVVGPGGRVSEWMDG